MQKHIEPAALLIYMYECASRLTGEAAFST